MRGLVCILILLFQGNFSFAQFDPAGGEVGSKAVHYQSDKIKSWADSVFIEAGYINLADTSLGKVTSSTYKNALGTADNLVQSLGDGGRATYVLNSPVKDELGYDFAIYENGFKAGNAYYLELAKVSLSSDGINFFEFSSICLNDTGQQIAFGGVMNPVKINNLAGKHPTFWGTPFNISELPNDPLLDKAAITHIRITDVVGSLNPLYGTKDSNGQWINDPWPTPFSSSGFDLDALAILNPGYTGISEASENFLIANPLHVNQIIENPIPHDATVLWMNGNGVITHKTQGIIQAPETSGIYFLIIQWGESRIQRKLCVVSN